MIEKNFIELFENSFKKHWDLPAMSNYQGKTYYYKDFAKCIAQWHITFEQLKINKGDRIALMGKDSAEWSIIFLATITYGAVIVPILQDFSASDAMSIVDHSESKLLFINQDLFSRFDLKDIPVVENIISIQNNKPLYSSKGIETLSAVLLLSKDKFYSTYEKGFTPNDIKYYHTHNSEMILLNYTSGTTGFSKGVMISGNSLAGNLLFCIENKIVNTGEKLLCFLPMAHTYSCMTHLLLSMSIGVHVTILGKVPTPQILRKALNEIKPQVMISVPLVLEKIYINIIMPIIDRKNFRALLNIPIINRFLFKKIRQKLIRGLGGNIKEVIVGGAAINPEVGAFLYRIGFPITVGYGMTECGPLISYSSPAEWKIGSCGRVLKGYVSARISPIEKDSFSSFSDKVGEIQVKGENVCMGYFKNEEETKMLFTDDGWMRTGDLGLLDNDNVLYIKGRSKTMYLSGNGQNIYPEEIEAKINLIKYVLESLVVMRDTKLEALIVLNKEVIKAEELTEEQAWSHIKASRAKLNESLGSYEKIQKFNLMEYPFEKTPKQSIKRFLYK